MRRGANRKSICAIWKFTVIGQPTCAVSFTKGLVTLQAPVIMTTLETWLHEALNFIGGQLSWGPSPFSSVKSMAIAKSSSWRSWFLDSICALYVFCSVSRKYMVVLEDCLLLNPPKLRRIDVKESSWVQSLAQWLWLQGRGLEVDAMQSRVCSKAAGDQGHLQGIWVYNVTHAYNELNELARMVILGIAPWYTPSMIDCKGWVPKLLVICFKWMDRFERSACCSRKLGALRSPRKMNIYILVGSNGFQIRHVWIPRRVLQWQQCLAFPMATGATSILGNSAMATAVEAGRQWLVPKMLRALRSHHVSRGSTMALGVDL